MDRDGRIFHDETEPVASGMPARVAIVGGGIAGLATAYHLARGATPVTLYEREAFVATHSSARNAAIFSRLGEGAWGDLSRRSRELLDAMLGRARWLRQDGFLHTAPDAALLRDEIARAEHAGAPHVVLGRRELEQRIPLLEKGSAEVGILLLDGGVLDIDAITAHLAHGAQAAGARIALGSEVERVRVVSGRVRGVELAGGRVEESDAVVLAPGAWAASLGASLGAPLPLQPLRRHLVQLDLPGCIDEDAPTVWALGHAEVYFRPESGGVLASPCDEVPWPPSLPPVDPDALDRLIDRLAALAPALTDASVRRSWACLRTFAPDRLPVIGADPRVGGLYWLAALGGSGMSMGVAAGELLAAIIAGREHALAATVGPGRLIGR